MRGHFVFFFTSPSSCSLSCSLFPVFLERKKMEKNNSFLFFLFLFFLFFLFTSARSPAHVVGRVYKTAISFVCFFCWKRGGKGI